MATLLTIRPLEGEPVRIAIDGGLFADPEEVTIDSEIETSELWAVPGLADAHAHLTMQVPTDIRGISEEQMRANIPAMAWAQVDRGVLLILDKGSASDLSLLSLDHDADLRPHVEAAGAIIRPTHGYMPGFGAEVEPDDLVEHIRTRAETRGGWVKIIGDWPRKGEGPKNNYPLDRLTEAVDVAHAAGARVAVHTMAYSASDAVTAGADSIEHGPFLTSDDLEALADRGGAWVPTVANMLDVLNTLGRESTGGRLFAEGLDRMRENLPLAESLGVTVLAGTDMGVRHGEVSIEAQRLVEYGMSHRGATRAASLDAYGYVGMTDTFRPGTTADAVFFRDHPYDDVSILTDPALVIRRGRTIRPKG
ncbi:MAG TPA: amidohydrolase family protein [Acidimicrobiia bacterium]|nr:amidohydrolase family protein [Acidimicrobiia bacterium]